VSAKVRLFLASFLMFFVELALIRWLPGEVVYLAFFANFILLASFLGIGIGFLRSSYERDLSSWAPVALGTLVVLVLAFPVAVPGPQGATLPDIPGPVRGLSAWFVVPFLFVTVTAVMAFIGERVARLFATLAPLEAYRLDILGSLCGIVTFSALSFLWAPPVVWGGIVAVSFVALDLKKLRLVSVFFLIGMVVVLGTESTQLGTSWSPYYKMQVSPTTLPDGEVAYGLAVNGIPQQDAEPLAAIDKYDVLHYHSAVYDHLKHPAKSVLIIGAGTGNDVAVALAHGAQHVDAVEIDPHTQQLGVQLHPNHPYADPRVTVHIDDGRAFLQQTTNHYDLILFSLPDSLFLISGQSSLRLESYLLTEESMETVRDHLAPGGVFSQDNYYVWTWLVDRLGNTLQLVYGHAPCIDHQSQQDAFAVFTISSDPQSITCQHLWTDSTNPVPAPATDDHPYLYIQDNTLPPLYEGMILGVLLATLIGLRLSGVRYRTMRPYADLFLMGSAFLLLETKSVVQFALLFGSTWFVNALVFFGVLVAVLAAIEVSRLVRIARPKLLYLPLFGGLALAWIVPQASLLQLSTVPRLFAAIALAFAPIFFANMIFAQRFKSVSTSTVAFGTNLLGAMVGGLLEYGSLIVGYRALLIVVALLYAGALILNRDAASPILAG
jgi:Spermine/spermidine synthase domain